MSDQRNHPEKAWAPETLRCVLFDFEGTLVDFQWRLAEAEAELRHALKDLGYALEPFASDNYAVLRTRALELAPSPAVGQAVERAFGPIYDRYDEDALSRWSLAAGVGELLEALRAAGLGVGLVTNIGRAAIEKALLRFGLARAFDVVVTRNQVARAKPSGDGLRRALALLGARPEEALFVGDSVSDLLAARDAGMRVAIVGGGESSRADIERLGPDCLLGRVAETIDLVRQPARSASGEG